MAGFAPLSWDSTLHILAWVTGGSETSRVPPRWGHRCTSTPHFPSGVTVLPQHPVSHTLGTRCIPPAP